jgi:XRE family transcriptional regulator, regulator of sulfur utilization
MMEPPLPSPPSVAATLKRLRRQKNLSLEELAQLSGVSRSMLSQIERDTTNPTVATLWRITTALGVSIDEALSSSTRSSDFEVLPSHALPQMGSADGLMVLRVLGPLTSAGTHEWYELTAKPKAVLESKAHAIGTREHLYVSEGEFTVASGEQRQIVAAGSLARYRADLPHTLRNSGKGVAKAWLTVLLA